jgi:hypothetical protein
MMRLLCADTDVPSDSNPKAKNNPTRNLILPNLLLAKRLLIILVSKQVAICFFIFTIYGFNFHFALFNSLSVEIKRHDKAQKRVKNKILK